MSRITVLLADDQALVRAGIRTILHSEPGIDVIGEAADGDEAIEQAKRLNPDVICMDVQMPGRDGLSATASIVSDPGIRSAVLILTTFNREDYLFEALRHGASGFVLKNATPEALIEAVQIVARGDALLSPDVTRRVIERFAGGPAPTGPTAPPAAFAALTPREREVLSLVAAGLANHEIARSLHLGEATVKTHVSNVLQKLDLRDRIQAIVYAYENRIITPGERTDLPTA